MKKSDVVFCSTIALVACGWATMMISLPTAQVIVVREEVKKTPEVPNDFASKVTEISNMVDPSIERPWTVDGSSAGSVFDPSQEFPEWDAAVVELDKQRLTGIQGLKTLLSAGRYKQLIPMLACARDLNPRAQKFTSQQFKDLELVVGLFTARNEAAMAYATQVYAGELFPLAEAGKMLRSPEEDPDFEEILSKAPEKYTRRRHHLSVPEYADLGYAHIYGEYNGITGDFYYPRSKLTLFTDAYALSRSLVSEYALSVVQWFAYEGMLSHDELGGLFDSISRWVTH